MGWGVPATIAGTTGLLREFFGKVGLNRTCTREGLRPFTPSCWRGVAMPAPATTLPESLPRDDDHDLENRVLTGC